MSHTSEIGTVRQLLQQAESKSTQGDHVAARILFQQAIASDDSGVALNAYGLFQKRRGELEEALDTFERLMQLADENADAELRAAASNNLACLCRDLGEPDIAASWQQQSWQAAQTNGIAAGTHVELGCDLSNRANDALIAEDFELAEKLFNLALQWEEKQGDRARQGDDWGSLGLVAAFQGDFETALERLQTAARLHREAGDLRGAGADLLNVAELCAAQFDWEPGLRICAEAQQLLQSVGATDLHERAIQTCQILRRGQLVSTFDATRN